MDINYKTEENEGLKREGDDVIKRIYGLIKPRIPLPL